MDHVSRKNVYTMDEKDVDDIVSICKIHPYEDKESW
jgi:hypothetical protein